MKRIIDGVTYNTATATVIARSEEADEGWANGGERIIFTLYHTPGGAFFIHSATTIVRKNLRTEEWEEIERHEFEPMTRAAAERWVMSGQVELLNDVFAEPPEATAEATPGSTLYTRVPTSLKDQSEALARSEGLSMNAWIIRCVEQCGQKDKIGALLGEIMQTAQAAACGAYDAGMIVHMRQKAEDVAELLGWHEKALEELCINACAAAARGDSDHYRWPLEEEETEEERRERVAILLESQKAEDAGRDSWRRKIQLGNATKLKVTSR